MAMTPRFALAFLALTQPAAALASEWTYMPGPLAGHAEVVNAAGNRLSVTCGNSGELGIALEPDPRTVEGGTIARFRLMIDGGASGAFDVEMRCSSRSRCETGGTGNERPVVAALRAGRWVEIWWDGVGLDAFALTGSSRAIESMRIAGCPGF